MEPDFSKAPPPRPEDYFTSSDAAYHRAQEMLAAGYARHQAGDFAPASDIYRQVLTLDPRNFDALHLLGLIAWQAGDFAQAATLIAQALEINPFHAGACFNHGLVCTALGQHTAALAAYDRCIELNPVSAEAHSQRATVLWTLRRHQAAIASFDKAIALNPGLPDAFNNRGIVLWELKRHADALASYDAAIALQPDFAAFHNNRGVTLAAMNDDDAALAAYDRAIALQPDYAEAHNNRGLTLRSMGRVKAALAAHDEAMRLNPDIADTHNYRGIALAALQQPEAAVAAYDRALHLNPEVPYLYGARLHLKMLMCDWTNFDTEVADLCARIARGARASASFPLLALSDSQAVHRQAAAIWAADKHSPNPALGAVQRPGQVHSKIRVGYFSMDFRDHPVASLTVGLFEAHDRAAFEIYGFSYGADTQDDMRKRLEGAFDRFIDVRTKSDMEIAALARALELDIAVDLAGYTGDARTGIFALRAAPVQASYLGYPGTMMVDYIDYMVADGVMIPEANQAHYSEKIVTLPNYQVNGAGRGIADKVFTRSELGLPATGFVFCCFNNTYKITPTVFDGWMRILKAVEGGVLFLYADSEQAAANLRKEAAARGVDPARLVFGTRLPVPEYLARFRTADLFLDTLPYNAGTTASDALWAGLPVLTQRGTTMAGRMAASLLHAVDLPELVTATQAEYEALAIALARDPARHAALKAKLARNRPTSPLFDAGRLARHMETAYRQMHARQGKGLPPDHIVVEPFEAARSLN